MSSFPRTLVSIAPLCNVNLTVIFTKHDIKAYDQDGATILEGWCNPSEANDWHFPIIDSDHISNEDSLFSSNEKLTIIPPPDPPPEPLPPPPTLVPTSYWDHIKHEKRPSGMVQLSNRERLDCVLVTTIEQS
jgi:hypothetical protein